MESDRPMVKSLKIVHRDIYPHTLMAKIKEKFPTTTVNITRVTRINGVYTIEFDTSTVLSDEISDFIKEMLEKRVITTKEVKT